MLPWGGFDSNHELRSILIEILQLPDAQISSRSHEETCILYEQLTYRMYLVTKIYFARRVS